MSSDVTSYGCVNAAKKKARSNSAGSEGSLVGSAGGPAGSSAGPVGKAKLAAAPVTYPATTIEQLCSAKVVLHRLTLSNTPVSDDTVCLLIHCFGAAVLAACLMCKQARRQTAGPGGGKIFSGGGANIGTHPKMRFLRFLDVFNFLTFLGENSRRAFFLLAYIGRQTRFFWSKYCSFEQ